MSPVRAQTGAGRVLPVTMRATHCCPQATFWDSNLNFGFHVESTDCKRLATNDNVKQNTTQELLVGHILRRFKKSCLPAGSQPQPVSFQSTRVLHAEAERWQTSLRKPTSLAQILI